MQLLAIAAFLSAMASVEAKSARLFATVYSGSVDTLELATSANGNSTLTKTASAIACGQSPSWLTLDRVTNTLYCANEGQNPNGSVSSFTISHSGALGSQAVATTIGSNVNSQLYGGSKGDGFIALAEYGTSSISTFALPLQNSSAAVQSWTYNLSHPGPAGVRQDAPHPHQVILDPTGEFLLSPDLGADLIRVFSVDNASGHLTPQTDLQAAPGSGPRHVGFYVPSGNPIQGTYMYLASEIANTLTAYKLTYPQSGRAYGAQPRSLSFTKIQGPIYPYPNDTAPTGVTSYVSEVRVRNNTLTVSNRGDQSFGPGQDSLALLSLCANGTFTFKSLYPAGGSYPRTFVINAAGDRIATGLQQSNAVAVLERDPGSGVIGKLLGNVTLEGQVSSVIWDE